MMQTWPRSGGRVSGPGVPASIKTSPPRTEVREKPPRREEGEPLGRPRWRPPRLRARPPPLRLTGDRIASTPNRMSASRVATPKAANGLALPGLLLRPARPSDGPAQRKRGGGAETAESPNRRGGGLFAEKFSGPQSIAHPRLRVLGTRFCCALVFFLFSARFFWPKETKKKTKKGNQGLSKT